MAKYKKFNICRPEIEVTIVKPIRGAMMFLLFLPLLVTVRTVNIAVLTPEGVRPIKKRYYFIIPKFTFKKGAKE